MNAAKTNVAFKGVGGTEVPEDNFYPFQISERYLIMSERRALIGELVAIKRGFLLFADACFFDTEDMDATLRKGTVKAAYPLPGLLVYRVEAIQWATAWPHKLPAIAAREAILRSEAKAAEDPLFANDAAAVQEAKAVAKDLA